VLQLHHFFDRYTLGVFQERQFVKFWGLESAPIKAALMIALPVNRIDFACTTALYHPLISSNGITSLLCPG
jgi:hypothetical protein